MMINSKKNTTKRALEVNNYEVMFDIVNILELVNSINSRLARVERQIKEINGSDKNE